MIQRSEIWLLIVTLSMTVSCTHQTRHASIGDFTDQVLEPLAARLADEKIIEKTALIRAAQTPAASHQTIAAVLQELPWIGKMFTVVNTTRQAYLEQDLAWLETRRIPLRHELLSIFRSRTQQDGNAFAFCVNGVERRYQAIEQGRFSRLDDGSGPCETTPLQSLKRNSAG